MQESNRTEHWEKIYEIRSSDSMSWYEATPAASLSFLRECQLPFDARIIDVGGGDSLLVDHLLRLGYTNVTVLDISAKALERVRQRLGPRQAAQITWIVSDITTFEPSETYDFWHDRAAFHFLTQLPEIGRYVDLIARHIRPAGHLVLGTFSENGPKKCSGLEVHQYSETTLTDLLKPYFEKVRCITTDHVTPAQVVQNFLFCRFHHR